METIETNLVFPDKSTLRKKTKSNETISFTINTEMKNEEKLKVIKEWYKEYKNSKTFDLFLIYNGKTYNLYSFSLKGGDIDIYFTYSDEERTYGYGMKVMNIQNEFPTFISDNPEFDISTLIKQEGAGGTGTNNYDELKNKPSINGIELIGNLLSSDLDLDGIETLTGKKEIWDIPTGIYNTNNLQIYTHDVGMGDLYTISGQIIIVKSSVSEEEMMGSFKVGSLHTFSNSALVYLEITNMDGSYNTSFKTCNLDLFPVYQQELISLVTNPDINEALPISTLFVNKSIVYINRNTIDFEGYLEESNTETYKELLTNTTIMYSATSKLCLVIGSIDGDENNTYLPFIKTIQLDEKTRRLTVVDLLQQNSSSGEHEKSVPTYVIEQNNSSINTQENVVKFEEAMELINSGKLVNVYLKTNNGLILMTKYKVTQHNDGFIGLELTNEYTIDSSYTKNVTIHIIMKDSISGELVDRELDSSFIHTNYLPILYTTDTKTHSHSVLSIENTEQYTPTSQYHPATKGYVDDLVGDIQTLLEEI